MKGQKQTAIAPAFTKRDFNEMQYFVANGITLMRNTAEKCSGANDAKMYDEYISYLVALNEKIEKHKALL